jgi:capsid protein
LDRVFDAWWAEARRLPEFAMEAAFLGRAPRRQWYWPGRKHVDPLKEAAAEGELLRNNRATLADLYASDGKDWRREIRQRAREKAFMAKIAASEGLSPADLDEGAPLSADEKAFAEGASA